MIPRVNLVDPKVSLHTSGADQTIAKNDECSVRSLDVQEKEPTSSSDMVSGENSSSHPHLVPPKIPVSFRGAASDAKRLPSVSDESQFAVNECIKECIKLRDSGFCSRAIDVIDSVLKGTVLSDEQRAILLMHKGRNYQQPGDFQKAIEVYEQADQMFANTNLTRRSNSSFQIAMAKLLWLRKETSGVPDAVEIRAAFTNASQALDDELQTSSLSEQRRAEIIHNQAFILEQKEDLQKSISKYTEALELRKALKDIRGQAYTCHRLAICYRATGKLSDASQMIGRTISLYHLCGITAQPRLAEARAISDQLHLLLAKKDDAR